MHKCFSAPGRPRLRPLKARCLAGLLGLGVLSWSAMAAALGLGELELHSGLNQPFNADIDLLDTAGLGPDDLRVALASPEAFAKAGMDRPFFLSDLRFTPVSQGGKLFIHVQSNKAVIEPYLSLLVQVDRPGGQVLRGYTLLIDPPGSVVLAPPRVPTLGSRLAQAAPADAIAPPAAQAPAAAPAALPPASEGKRYEVQKGDTLWTIGKKLQAAGTPTPPNQLVRDIRALNPQRGPLKAGDSLLLPDAAVLPGAPPAAAPEVTEQTASTTAPAEAPAPAPAPDMAASVLNQQLQQNLDEVQGRVKALEAEVANKNQQVQALQGQLAGQPAPATAPAAPGATPAPTASAPATAPAAPAPAQAPTQAQAPAPAATPAPAPAPVAAPTAPMVEDDSWMLQAAALALLVLLGGLLLWRRRRARQPQETLDTDADEPLLATPVAVAPAPAAVAPVPMLDTPAAPARKASPATDALDGASIYIAYGRFNEALGILREGLRREPHREDLRLRILEVLAQQGDAQAYLTEETAMRAQGVPARELENVRERFPKIALALAATSATAAAASSMAVTSVPSPAAAPEPEPEAEPEQPAEAAAALRELDEPEFIADVPADEEADADLLGLDLSELPDLEGLDDFTLPAAPAAEPEPQAAADEFQLNLDDLSLDADWASVDPFDTPAKAVASTPDAEPEAAPVEQGLDANFTSNLNEFPEVFELSEEHYLGDLSDAGGSAEVERVNEFDASALDVEFGGDFDALEPLAEPVEPGSELADLPDLPDLAELDSLSLDFEAIDSQQLAADKLEQARALLDQGEQAQASRLLYELLREGDDASRQDARALLARLEQ